MSDDDTRRFFASFANTVLERSLPQIRAWLKSRLGPRASLGGLELEGEKVRLKDAHLPFGGHLVLHVDTALLRADPSALVAAAGDLASALRSVRIERMQGTLHAYRDGEPALSAPLQLVARTTPEWLDADVTVEGGEWRVVRGVGDAAPLAGRARIRVNGPSWSITEVALESGASSVEGGVHGAAREVTRADVQVKKGRLGHLADAFEALTARRAPPVPLPWEALVDARFVREGATTRLSIHAASEAGEASRLSLELALDGERIAKAEVEARLSWRDVEPARGHVEDDSDDVVIEGRLEGTRSAPRGTVTATCAELRSPHLAHTSALLARLDFEGSPYPQVRLQLPGALTAALRPTLDRAAGDTLGGDGEAELVPGAFRVRGAAIEGPAFPLRIMLRGTRSSPGFGARFETPALTVSPPHGRLHLRRVTGSVGYAGALTFALDARVGTGSVSLDQERAAIERLDTPDLEAALCLIAPGLLERYAVPPGTQLWADLRRRSDGVEGRVHAEAPRSRVSLAPLRLSRERGWEGTRVQSLFEFEDAREAGLWRLAHTPTGKVQLDARVEDGALRLVATSRALGIDTPGVPAEATLESARVEAWLSRGRVELRSLEGRLLEGALSAKGRWTQEEGLLLERARLEGARPWGEVRLDASVRGTLDRLHGTAEAKTDRSALTLALGTRDGRFEETRLEGWLDPVDLPTPRGLTFTEGERWAIQARAEGALADPTVELRAHAPRQSVAFGPRALTLDDAYFTLSGTRRAIDVSELRAKLLDGRVRGQVHVGLSGFRGVLGELSLEGVELASLSLPVEGAASARLAFHRRAVGPPHALLRLRVAAPRYPGLSRLAPTLERLGLGALPIEGNEPLLASLRLEGDALELFDLGAGVAGARVSGALTKDPLWSGALLVHAAASWLKSHRVLGAAGDLTVPLRVGGDGLTPRVRPDVLAAIDAWIGKSKVGASVQRLLDQLASKAPPPDARPHAPDALAGTDALLDRVLDGDRAERALEALLDRGLSPREVADALERRLS